MRCRRLQKTSVKNMEEFCKIFQSPRKILHSKDFLRSKTNLGQLGTETKWGLNLESKVTHILPSGDVRQLLEEKTVQNLAKKIMGE